MSTRRKEARERARAAAAARAAATAHRRRMTAAATAIAAVLATALILVLVKVASHPAATAAAPQVTGSAASAVTDAVTHVDPTVLTTVANGGGVTAPKALTGQPALTDGGKPLIVYIGAEYCPYCAAERWAVVVALSRFGTFANLGVTHSASDDIYPNTATLSFHAATYTSQYLSFQGVETQTNARSGNTYTALDTPTTAQKQLMNKYDAAPYTDSAGSIPFVDLANRYLISGASYSPQVLAGKTAQQIADALSNPDDPIAKAVDGTANALTADLCQITGNQPATACATASATPSTSQGASQ